MEIITRMYRQQKNHFQNNDSRESIPNRIVSLSKPHLRPIVRGKEVKSVEFGAKINSTLVDGISFNRTLVQDGNPNRRAISLDPSYISKSGKKTPSV